MKYQVFVGETADQAFSRIAGSENLFCIAFFGHKGTKQQKSKLSYIWKSILKQLNLNCLALP